MELVKSIEEYKSLLNEIKKRDRRCFNNNYCYIPMIQRLISMERLYYVNNETGLYLYMDEESYYRLVFYLVSGENFYIENVNKPIVVRNIYKQNTINEKMLTIQQSFKEHGLQLYYSIFQMEVASEFLRNEELVYSMKEQSCMELNAKGFTIGYPSDDISTEIVALRENAKEISPYHYQYKTKKELRHNIDNQNYLCIINNTNDEVCAAVEKYYENNCLLIDWISVKPEFQNGKGFGKALHLFAFAEAVKQGIDHIYTWVPQTNERSLYFHKKNHWNKTGKITDEWIWYPEK